MFVYCKDNDFLISNKNFLNIFLIDFLRNMNCVACYTHILCLYNFIYSL